MKRFLAVLGALVACSSQPTTSSPPVVYDTYQTVHWSYAYSYPGYVEGLDSIVGTLTFAVARAPSDSFVARSATGVLGYFWGHATARTDTARGTGTVWPPAFELRALQVPLSDTRFKLRNPNHATWLTPTFAYEFKRSGTDTLVFVTGVVTVDSVAYSLIVTAVRAP